MAPVITYGNALSSMTRTDEIVIPDTIAYADGRYLALVFLSFSAYKTDGLAVELHPIGDRCNAHVVFSDEHGDLQFHVRATHLTKTLETVAMMAMRPF